MILYVAMKGFIRALKVFGKSFVLPQRNKKAFSFTIYLVKYCRDIFIKAVKSYDRYTLLRSMRSVFP